MRVRFSGLDGLRGLAVIAVVLYHAGFPILSGGFLGVDVFFVLSGFLITSLFLEEIAKSGTIDRAGFYLRRLRRLMPALISVLIFCTLASALWAHDAAYAVKRDLPWALTFVLNWSYLFFNQSYFVNISRPPLLQHIWSLSIEEQYYVVWPLIILIGLKLRWIRNHIRAFIVFIGVIGAVASTLWMRSLAMKNGYPIPNDPSRVYFGTDTHAMGLLIGSALAGLVNVRKFNTRLTPDRRAAMQLLTLGSFAGLLYFLFQANEFDPVLYQYGFLAVSLLTAGLILCLIHPALAWGKIADNGLLQAIGRRSYGIYLWHWPIFMLLRPGVDVNWPEPVVFTVRIALVLIISSLSYKYLEIPIRNGIIKRTLIRWRSLGIPRPHIGIIVPTAAMLISILLCFVLVVKAPMPTGANAAVFGGITSLDSDPTAVTATPSASPTPTPSRSTSAMPNRHGRVVIFGDSVVLSGRKSLQTSLTSISIDAAVGRQPWEIAKRIQLRRSQGRLADYVVIHMGTNGLVSRKDLSPILSSLRDRKRVVVVNVQVPRVWMKQTNTMINSIISQYPNVRLANWRDASAGHSSYFTSDGVHLTETGGKIFARIIKRALQAE